MLIGAVAREGRTTIIPAGTTPVAYVVPLALCAAVVLLLAFPAIALPHRGRSSGTGGGIERTQPLRIGSVSLLLLPLVLASCGSAVVAPLPDATIPLLTNFAPPFAVRTGAGTTEAVWRIVGGLTPTPDGSALVAGSGSGTATAPRVAVGNGDRYRLSLRMTYPGGGMSGGSLAAQWLDTNNVALGEERVPLEIETVRTVAAVPGTAAVRLVLSLPPGAIAGDLRLTPLDGGRLDPWPDYHRAAFAFTFDWETAMGGLIHTRGGVREHDVTDAEARGLRMRQGAIALRRQFDIYGIKATWLCERLQLSHEQHREATIRGEPDLHALHADERGVPHRLLDEKPVVRRRPLRNRGAQPGVVLRHADTGVRSGWAGYTVTLVRTPLSRQWRHAAATRRRSDGVRRRAP